MTAGVDGEHDGLLDDCVFKRAGDHSDLRCRRCEGMGLARRFPTRPGPRAAPPGGSSLIPPADRADIAHARRDLLDRDAAFAVYNI
ncbi:hypothetical protein [Streptosporangium sp. CA-115845]|uniref:hypothetical protein n=1 Tax=Streptosporangium sp. CA-115845 TaxID=3240071 RepID=UPI003D8AEC63